MQKLTIKEIDQLLFTGKLNEDDLKILERDKRKGVKELLKKYYRAKQETEDELKRLQKLKEYELEARESGFSVIAGVDEAGRGPLAGPVVAAAVILPMDIDFIGLDDSKKMSVKMRDMLYEQIKEEAIDIGVGIAEADVIDEINIYQATMKAMRTALSSLYLTPEYILVDGFPVKAISIPQKALKKGDSLSISIAAASVVAKVTRDRIMDKLDRQYPQYGFARNKGYGTGEHRMALQKYGASPIHRRSFFLGNNQEPLTDNKRKRGTDGESIAAGHLKKMGYEIIQRNYRCPVGEIDLIAMDGEYTVFIEVRTRWSNRFGTPEESVTAAKRDRLSKIAQYYMTKKLRREVPCRLDFIGLELDKRDQVTRLNHIKDIR